VVLIAFAAASPARRVGDGGEYFVMALQLAAARPPSLSPDELRDVKSELTRLGAGFETALLDYPDLVGRDGRQDFLHFFLYPLVVAPAVPFVNLFGLHPNWAFTIVNATLLALAVFLIARHQPAAVWIAGFVSPIVWWVDKAHTEAFLFATLAVAAVLVRERPAWALVAFALAGAQNAAIGVTYPFFVALMWRATRPSTFTPRTWLAAVVGAGMIASPFVYTLIRLGRLSPMAEYAQRVIPTPGGVAAFVVEPNIGILPSAPVFGVMIVAFAALLLMAVRPRGRAARGVTAAQSLTAGNVGLPASGHAPLWWWPVVIQLLLLLLWSQNPNLNHGGTPGMNRWVLSLLALGLPWIADIHRVMPSAGRMALTLIVSLLAVVSAAAHVPSRPEQYREPTRLAAWMWARGWVHATPAEVFAERTGRREPAFAPSHEGECRVMLIADQHAPVECRPPLEPLPANCRRPGAMCYGLDRGDRMRYVTAPTNGFYYNVAEPSWPAGGPLAAGINRVLREANPSVRVWRLDSSRAWRDRLAGADVGAVLVSPRNVVLYVTRVSGDALREFVSEGNAQVYSLIPFGVLDLGAPHFTNVAVVLQKS
jgi:hypothetical protein